MYFEDEAKKHEGLSTSTHIDAERRLEALSDYILHLPEDDPRLTPFLLLHEQLGEMYAPSFEVARTVARIGLKPGADNLDHLFMVISRAAMDDVYNSAHCD